MGGKVRWTKGLGKNKRGRESLILAEAEKRHPTRPIPLDSMRLSRDADKVAQEIAQHWQESELGIPPDGGWRPGWPEEFRARTLRGYQRAVVVARSVNLRVDAAEAPGEVGSACHQAARHTGVRRKQARSRSTATARWGCFGGAGRDAGFRTPPTLRVRGRLPIFDPPLAHGSGVGQGPVVRQEFEQVRAPAQGPQDGSVRRGPVCAARLPSNRRSPDDGDAPADHAAQLQRPVAALGCPRNCQLFRPTVKGRSVCSDWALSIGILPSSRYTISAAHWFRR